MISSASVKRHAKWCRKSLNARDFDKPFHVGRIVGIPFFRPFDNRSDHRKYEVVMIDGQKNALIAAKKKIITVKSAEIAEIYIVL